MKHSVMALIGGFSSHPLLRDVPSLRNGRGVLHSDFIVHWLGEKNATNSTSRIHFRLTRRAIRQSLTPRSQSDMRSKYQGAQKWSCN